MKKSNVFKVLHYNEKVNKIANNFEKIMIKINFIINK